MANIMSDFKMWRCRKWYVFRSNEIGEDLSRQSDVTVEDGSHKCLELFRDKSQVWERRRIPNLLKHHEKNVQWKYRRRDQRLRVRGSRKVQVINRFCHRRYCSPSSIIPRL